MEVDKHPEHTIEECLMRAVKEGRMTEEEAKECLEAYENTFHKPDRRIPIQGDDPLSSPIGYYEEPENIYK